MDDFNKTIYLFEKLLDLTEDVMDNEIQDHQKEFMMYRKINDNLNNVIDILEKVKRDREYNYYKNIVTTFFKKLISNLDVYEKVSYVYFGVYEKSLEESGWQIYCDPVVSIEMNFDDDFFVSLINEIDNLIVYKADAIFGKKCSNIRRYANKQFDLQQIEEGIDDKGFYNIYFFYKT